MKNKFFTTLAVLAVILSGCGKFGKSKGLPNDGQVHGVAPSSALRFTKTSRNGIYSTRNISYGPK